MRIISITLAFLMLASINAPTAANAADPKQTANELEKNFDAPPDSAKPWVFMWWYGKITPADITQHEEELKAKGVGGVLLFYLGGMPGMPFLSDPWRELFRHTVREADRLGLKMGANVCKGWPSGGPWITPENASRMVVSSETILKGPQKFSGKLTEPTGKGKLYEDVAVQAFPIAESDASRGPVLTASANPARLANLLDGNYNTVWSSGAKGQQWLLLDFGAPHTIDWAWIDAVGTMTIEASDDGTTFKPIATLVGPRWTLIYTAVPPTTARWFRVLVPNNVIIHDLALGTKEEVERVAAMAAKRALTNPLGVTDTRQADQVAFVRKDLQAFPTVRPLKLEAMLDLTDKCAPDGTLNWDVPPGSWKVVRIGQTTTGIGAGGGLLPDYLSKAATERSYEQALKLLIADAGPLVGKTFQYFHEDNVEIGGIYSWTPKMAEEFRARRGYDPTPYFSAMAGEIVGDVETTDRFLTDVRRTIADCVADWHYEHWAKLAHADGMKVRAEAGGQHHPRLLTNDGLMNQGRMDQPVGEFWENEFWKENQWAPLNHHLINTPGWDEAAQNVNVKQTASAGHLYGKPLVASESFTSLGPRSLWGVAPGDLLLYANITFCEGINAMTIHGSATSGPENGKPGNVFGAGTQFNHNVTWWNQSGPFLRYLARCQQLLRQGVFVADVLYYNGDEAPNFVPPKNIDPSRGFGYDYDVCNSEIVLTRLSVKDGRIVLPDGMSYRVLVLPERPVMPLAVLEKIDELVKAGATVIGQKPLRIPGLTGYPQSEERLKEIADKLWVKQECGKGRVLSGVTIREVLEKNGVPPDLNGATLVQSEAGVPPAIPRQDGSRDGRSTSENSISFKPLPPDFAFKTDAPDAMMDFIHRRDGDTEIYFVINRRNTTLNADCTFRVSGKQPELWDAVTGERSAAKAFKQADGQTTLPLELPPYGSMFVVFQKPVTGDGKADRNAPVLMPVQTLDGSWTVQFDPKWGGPDQPVTFETLQDWTQLSEEGIKFYSGTATYRKTFDLGAAKSPQRELYLDLGVVKNVAEVRLNGKKLGVVWCPPWRIDISKAVKAKDNKLEIDVVNLWPNRLIGDGKLPPEKRFTKTNIQSFYKGEHTLLPSGLLGPAIILGAQNPTKP